MFLLTECERGECVREQAAIARVIRVVGAQDGVDANFAGGHP